MTTEKFSFLNLETKSEEFRNLGIRNFLRGLESLTMPCKMFAILHSFEILFTWKLLKENIQHSKKEHKKKKNKRQFEIFKSKLQEKFPIFFKDSRKKNKTKNICIVHFFFSLFHKFNYQTRKKFSPAIFTKQLSSRNRKNTVLKNEWTLEGLIVFETSKNGVIKERKRSVLRFVSI